MMIFCRKKQRTNAKSGGTKVADRKHVGAYNLTQEGRQAKNGGVKGRDSSAEELDRETGQEQITVGWTRRKDGR